MTTQELIQMADKQYERACSVHQKLFEAADAYKTPRVFLDVTKEPMVKRAYEIRISWRAIRHDLNRLKQAQTTGFQVVSSLSDQSKDVVLKT